MRLLVISDSHHTPLDLDVSNYDAIFHCGDYGASESYLLKNNINFVKGNCDSKGDSSLLLYQFGKRIFVTHGHIENVKYGLDRLVYKALEKKADFCFFGHTHQVTCFQEENVFFINPGAYPESYVEITEDKILIYKKKTVHPISYRW